MIATLMILASVTFITMMSPGPDMMLIIKYSGARSRWPVFFCIAGIFCGLAVHVSLSILGIAAIIKASAAIYSMVKLLGAAYLIYIGIQSLRSKGGVALTVAGGSGDERRGIAFRDGLLCNVLNPKVTLFILAVFTQVVEPGTPVIEKVFYGAFIAFEAFVVWNIFASLVRTKLILGLLQRFQQTINRVVGVVLIGFGGSLVLEGFD